MRSFAARRCDAQRQVSSCANLGNMVLVQVTDGIKTKAFRATTAKGLLPNAINHFGDGSVSDQSGVGLTDEYGELEEGIYTWTAKPGTLSIKSAADLAAQLVVEHLSKRPRSDEDTGVASGSANVSLSVKGSDEVQMWNELVLKKGIPCSIVPVLTLVSPAREVLAALRWLQLLVSARDFVLEECFSLTRKREHEVPWHAPLLRIYQGAAAGQPDIAFAAEDNAAEDSAREDLCGLFRSTPCFPQQVQRKYRLANSQDEAGIHANKDGFGKLLKCICARYADSSLVHLVTFASRIEAVWVAKFTFGAPQCQEQAQQQPQQDCQERLPLQQPSTSTLPAMCSYRTLASVDVTPGFPQTILEQPAGAICRDINQAVEKLLQTPRSTLADLLTLASAGTPTAAPPGFTLLVQYVDKLCNMFGSELARPSAISAGQEVELSDAEVVHLGAKSVVLRLPGSDSVLKVAAADTIQRELDIHKAIDSKGCASLRSLSGLRNGSVTGAGGSLGFLELQFFCKPVCAHQPLPEGRRSAFWFQAEAAVQQLHDVSVVHRDIKPANFLDHDGDLVLNDFDVSHYLWDPAKESRRVGTSGYWSPRCDVEIPDWQYSTDDDWMALALTFATWCGVYRPQTFSKTADAALVKLGAVSSLLAGHFALPDAFKQRMQPVYDRVQQQMSALSAVS